MVLKWFKPKSTKTTPVISHPLISRARRFAELMDAAITLPVVNKKIGLDPIISLIPGGGDTVGLMLSCYLLWVAYQLRMPTHVYAGLVWNIIIDTGIGLIPVVGDVADFFWKSNLRNIALLEKAYLEYGDLSATGTPPIIDVQAEPS